MDENELALWLCDQISDSFGINVDTDNELDDATLIYVTIEGKEFEIQVKELIDKEE